LKGIVSYCKFLRISKYTQKNLIMILKLWRFTFIKRGKAKEIIWGHQQLASYCTRLFGSLLAGLYATLYTSAIGLRFPIVLASFKQRLPSLVQLPPFKSGIASSGLRIGFLKIYGGKNTVLKAIDVKPSGLIYHFKAYGESVAL